MAICTVTGQLRDFEGNGAAGKSLFFKLNTKIKDPFPRSDIGKKEIKTDANGDFTIDLQQTLLYVVRIPSVNVERTLTVPEETTIDLYEFWAEEDHQFEFFGPEES